MERPAIKNPNRLINEKSPYLLMHAQNPVDWHPWGKEARQKAREEEKPLLISIGYSACHWCHVMEKESFEDEETARVMNRHFVSVKVDREEMPDLDSLYMKAVQAMTGRGGWPLTVFATPEGIPFYGGTYFPPEDAPGLPSFKKVLTSVSEAYKRNKERIGAITEDIKRGFSVLAPKEPLKLEGEVSENAFKASRLFFDPVYGGFGEGPKFPHAMFLKFLLKYHKRTGDTNALAILKKALAAMAEGGMYDHLGGGFHRYSVDEAWEVPHFEKMLYDNALLLELYARAYWETKTGFYGDVATETAQYLLGRMRGGEGGFYSSEDADTGGGEGQYYLWTPPEIREALGEGDAGTFIEYFSVTDEGNFEGRNTLRINSRFKEPDEPVKEGIKAMKKRLLKARLRRTPPPIDKKAITAWNALAITALSVAGRVLERSDLIDAAKGSASFLLGHIKDNSGALSRYYLDGGAGTRACLEDYSLLGSALLSIHEATGEDSWLKEAHPLVSAITGLFYDNSLGVFFDTPEGHDGLFVRERDLFDNDVPSGNSAAAGFLLDMYRLRGEVKLKEYSFQILRSVEGMRDEPMGYGNFLSVLESWLEMKQGL